MSYKIIKTINEIIKLLKICTDPAEKYFCDFLVYTLDQLNKPHELHKIAENILKIYGGMESFNDVVIFANGEYLTEKHREFTKLKGILYKQCEQEISDAKK